MRRISCILQFQANRNTLIGRIHPHRNDAVGRAQRIGDLACIHRGTRPRRRALRLGGDGHHIAGIEGIGTQHGHRRNRFAKVLIDRAAFLKAGSEGTATGTLVTREAITTTDGRWGWRRRRRRRRRRCNARNTELHVIHIDPRGIIIGGRVGETKL